MSSRENEVVSKKIQKGLKFICKNVKKTLSSILDDGKMSCNVLDCRLEYFV